MVPAMMVLMGQDSIPRCICRLLELLDPYFNAGVNTILTMAASCSFIPCVAGFPPLKLVIGTDVPVVPGKAILTVY